MTIVLVIVACVASIGGYIAGFVMGRDIKMREAYELYKRLEENGDD